MNIKAPNKPAAPYAGITPRLTVECHWPVVGEPERRLLERMRYFIAIGCGVAQIVLAMKFCPESFEPVVYWALPVFHQIWHPWESGPNPAACFASLVLNAVIISAAVFWILGFRKRV
jgi:hypothetical protein